MTTIPVPVDFANVFTIILSAVIGIVWQSLRTQFKMTIEQVEAKCLSNDIAMKERIARLEEEVNNVPQKLDQVFTKLTAIELMLATHYATKAELREGITTRHDILDALANMDNRRKNNGR